ncbi:hypothetical protein DFP72DRAFT_848751 [Ephemerocybe angulata]|uniref:Uncharacterized protein n=1 Tax=Ephemerocybe angulata TaxID=980116 RepID=A0A8H6HV82_9AGAR|nr:hypothetical protein DFP72DRAFT_848751 [Tulosesus angulatus]
MDLVTIVSLLPLQPAYRRPRVLSELTEAWRRFSIGMLDSGGGRRQGGSIRVVRLVASLSFSLSFHNTLVLSPTYWLCILEGEGSSAPWLFEWDMKRPIQSVVEWGADNTVEVFILMVAVGRGKLLLAHVEAFLPPLYLKTAPWVSQSVLRDGWQEAQMHVSVSMVVEGYRWRIQGEAAGEEEPRESDSSEFHPTEV